MQNLQRNVGHGQGRDRAGGAEPARGTRTCACAGLLRNAVITDPKAFPLATRRRLDLLVGKYFPLESRERTGARARCDPRRG